MTEVLKTPLDVLKEIFMFFAIKPTGEQGARLGDLCGFKDGAIHLQVIGDEATMSVYGVSRDFALRTNPARVYRAGMSFAGVPRRILHNTISIKESSFSFHDEISGIIAAIDAMISRQSMVAAKENPEAWK